MTPSATPPPLITLEPLLEAVREGLTASGWRLSGLQKTTSYEFEGRWAGDSSRSAYLFFHRDDLGDGVSIDVFLDETGKGLKGNLALVVDGPPLSEMADPGRALSELSSVARRALAKGYRTPLTLRYRLGGLADPTPEADTEVRFKLHLPQSALQAGHGAVVALCEATATAFEGILGAPDMAPYLPPAED